VLTYESSIEQSMSSPNWKSSVRNTNQFSHFRQQSVVVFKDLRATINLELEKYLKKCKTDGNTNASIEECEKYFFDHYISQINSLLDNIEIRSFRSTFQIFSKDGKEISPADISSGESELITLGIECLSHELECKSNEENILLLDEPDVHIHPDLQAKLMHFLKKLADTNKFIVVIATHSAAILGALEDYEHVHFEFMKKGQKNFTFKKVLKEYKQIVPIFGAHPLSNIYCSMPIFLVEGEDDVWVWQKAICTSGGLLKMFPCAVDGVDEMLRYERMVSEIISTRNRKLKSYLAQPYRG
jgi:predicted ATP-dependent endonuclease of OLD family